LPKRHIFQIVTASDKHRQWHFLAVGLVGSVKSDDIRKIHIFRPLTCKAPKYASKHLCFWVKIHIRVKVFILFLALPKKLEQLLHVTIPVLSRLFSFPVPKRQKQLTFVASSRNLIFC
jgi:hypothetical protein